MTENTPAEPAVPAEPAAVAPEGYVPPAPQAPPAYVPPMPEAAPVVAAASAYDPVPLQAQVDTSRNWMGVISLVFGIIGGSVIAIVFGILGLVAVKSGKASNKGMNIWGIVLGAVWIVVTIVLFVALVVFAATSVDTNTMKSAEVGDCYTSTVQFTSDLVDVNPVFGSCAVGTNAEVYYVGEFDSTTGPDDAEFTSDLLDFCTSDAAVAYVDPDVAYDYFVEYYIPYATTWNIAPHTVVCGLSTSEGTIDPGAVLND